MSMAVELKDQRRRSAFRLGVLVSGSGTNLQSIIDKLHQGPAEIEVAVAISDRPDAYGLKRAEQAGIPAAVIKPEEYAGRREHDLAIAAELERRGVKLVVMAGYMRVMTAALLERFPLRVINLHPALLPSFPGAHGIEEALAYGVRITGVTVHFVDEGTDTGPVILQEAVDIAYNDTVESLAARIHAVEHRLLPQAIELIAAGRVSIDENNPRRVIVCSGKP